MTIIEATGTLVADKGVAAWQDDWILLLIIEWVEANYAIQREVEERWHIYIFIEGWPDAMINKCAVLGREINKWRQSSKAIRTIGITPRNCDVGPYSATLASYVVGILQLSMVRWISSSSSCWHKCEQL